MSVPFGKSPATSFLAVWVFGSASCTALVSIEHLAPSMPVERPGVEVSGGSQPAWVGGGLVRIAGPAPRLTLDSPEFRVALSTAWTRTRLLTFGPLLPVLPLFMTDPVDEEQLLSVNVHLERAANSMSLRPSASRLRRTGVPESRPASTTRSRWPDEETMPVPESGGELLLAPGEWVWLTWNVPASQVERFELTLAMGGNEPPLEFHFERDFTTCFAVLQ